MKKLMPLLATLMIAVALSTQLVLSQSNGLIKGRITDASGGAIPNVQITVRSPIDSFRTTSNESGEYEIGVPAGIYEIATEKIPGFAATKRKKVRVQANEIVELNIKKKLILKDAICILIVTSEPITEERKKKQRRRQ